MKIGFYAGSFDPFTNGHLHVIKVSSQIFDKIIIGIGVNTSKKRRFDKNIMKTAIENTLKSENITIVKHIYGAVLDNVVIPNDVTKKELVHFKTSIVPSLNKRLEEKGISRKMIVGE